MSLMNMIEDVLRDFGFRLGKRARLTPEYDRRTGSIVGYEITLKSPKDGVSYSFLEALARESGSTRINVSNYHTDERKCPTCDYGTEDYVIITIDLRKAGRVRGR